MLNQSKERTKGHDVMNIVLPFSLVSSMRILDSNQRSHIKTSGTISAFPLKWQNNAMQVKLHINIET